MRATGRSFTPRSTVLKVRQSGQFHSLEGAVLSVQIFPAFSFWRRLRGLLFRSPLQAGEGMWIQPCHSVHTLGMRYALDLIFLDKSQRVLRVVENLVPWRMANCSGAHSVIEMRGGTLTRHSIQVGDSFECHP
jgi:uncharacterized membrane protein (UPF0127 family)